MADTFIEFARMCVELRAIIREEMVQLSADLRNLHADLCRDMRQELLSAWKETCSTELLSAWKETCSTELEIPKQKEDMVHLHADLRDLHANLCRDVRQELLSTWNEMCGTKLELPKQTEGMVHLHADLQELPVDLCRDGQQELPKARFSKPINLQNMEESDPFKTTAYRDCRVPQSQVKDPNRVMTMEHLNGALPQEQLQPLAISQESESVAETLPGQLDDTDSISPPSCSPPELTVSDKDISSKSSKRFRQKHARKPRLQNAMGLVPDIDGERVNASGISMKIEDILRNRWFEYLSMSAVFANAVCIGLSSNHRATNLTEDTPAGFRAVDIVFFLYFCAEVVMKVIAFRSHFFSVFGWAWNAFDLVLVILQFLEEVVSLLNLGIDRGNGVHLIRMCRILRAVRCVRIMKLTLFTSEFRVLISCVMHCLPSFFWASLFLALVIFIKAIYITDSVVSQRIEYYRAGVHDEGLAKHYGSVPQSCLSLFQALTGGVDWNELLLPLNYSTWNVFLFMLYIAFGLLALMNLVTGLFVNHAIERASAVKDLQQLFQARKLFSALDIDASDHITEEELLSHMHSNAVQEFLFRLDMENDDLRVLFDIIDKDGGGSIDFEEFVNGLIHLSGTARSVDLLIMNHELRQFFRTTTTETGEAVFEPRWSKVGWQR